MHTTPINSLDSGRYHIRRRIGAGGMGIVFEAYDRQHDRVVALKLLRESDPTAIKRFKREFRSLADLSHPNLISLFEFSTVGDHSYFTMEFVDGVHLLRYVRPSKLGPTASDPADIGESLNTVRIRTALGQLTRGLMALHSAGIVHRDIKPSNVLVSTSGRVVIVDFGLAVETLHDSDLGHEDGMWGTVAYMAPEHGRHPPAPTQDWYAMGVIMYQALTGRMPRTGSASAILRNNWRVRPPLSPLHFAPDLPADLVDLCVALLNRDPTSRPTGREILRCLGFTGQYVDTLAAKVSGRSPHLVGRSVELALLHHAFYLVCTGRPVHVFVQGQSGIGKTELITRFLDQLSTVARVTLLRGRCRSRESVPHNALEGVVDDICAWFRSHPEHTASEVVGDGLQHLARLFPAVRTLATEPPFHARQTSDELETRRLALHTLQALIVHIARQLPLVIHIDDLHWSSDDEVRTLDRLFPTTDRSHVLLIVTFRSEALATHRSLRELTARSGEGTIQLRLDPLSVEDTRELMERLSAKRSDPSQVERIHRESVGNPLLIEQMIRYERTTPQQTTGQTSFHDIIATRLQPLPESAASILETLAVAGHPLPVATLRSVARLSNDPQPALNALVAARLVRHEGSDRYDMYHERLRDCLVAGVSPGTAAVLHRRLAESLEAGGLANPESLVIHYLEADMPHRARRHAIRAAEEAAATLAFDRAARSYARAIALIGPNQTETERLYSAMGRCWANAGRLEDAADAYGTAARLAKGAVAIEYRRLAAEYTLLGGRIELGLALVRDLLRDVGLTFPRTRLSAIVGLMWNRFVLAVRFRLVRVPRAGGPRMSGASDPVSIYRSIADGITNVDYIRGAYFQTRHAVLSLRRGRPQDIARALAIQSIFTLLRGGGRAERRAHALLAQAERLAARSDSRKAIALCGLMAGTMSYFMGEWSRSRTATARASEQLRQLGGGGAWELLTARFYHTFSLYYLGEIRELCRVTDEYLLDARDRGNRFATTIVRTGPSNVKWLVRDDPAGALEALRDAVADWPVTPFRVPHYLALAAEARAALYQGQPLAAWEAVTRSWPALRRSDLLRIQTIRIIMLYLRGASAASASRGRPDLRAIANRDAATLEGQNRRWADGLAGTLRGILAGARGNDEETAMRFRESIIIFDDTEMALHAAAVRRALGRLLGGDEGLALVAAADRWMSGAGIQNPERMSAMIAPIAGG